MRTLRLIVALFFCQALMAESALSDSLQNSTFAVMLTTRSIDNGLEVFRQEQSFLILDHGVLTLRGFDHVAYVARTSGEGKQEFNIGDPARGNYVYGEIRNQAVIGTIAWRQGKIPLGSCSFSGKYYSPAIFTLHDPQWRSLLKSIGIKPDRVTVTLIKQSQAADIW